MATSDTSLASLAVEAAVPRETLRRHLANPAGFKIDQLERVAAALDTSVLYLVGGEAA